jgi:hypothetical protein
MFVQNKRIKIDPNLTPANPNKLVARTPQQIASLQRWDSMQCNSNLTQDQQMPANSNTNISLRVPSLQQAKSGSPVRY